MTTPNIVYAHCHDAGRHIQPYGYPVPTPNLQKLAEEGVVFRRAFSMGPTCSPSRAALLTGQSPHGCGMFGVTNRNLGGFALNDYQQHLVHTLRRAGYKSTLCGFQHVADRAEQIGYDRILDLPDEARDRARTVAPRASEFLSSGPEEPFFLSVGTSEPHRIMGGNDPAWFSPDPENTDGRYARPPAILPDTPETRRDMADYIRAAGEYDYSVGTVMRALEENDLADRTLLIATTDHGIDFPGMKCNLTDHGLGVLLICRGPGEFTGGQVLDGLVSHVDVFPTLCEMSGIERPDWVEGVSLLPMVRGETQFVREEIHGEINYHGVYEPQRCVRTERWKYIRRFDEILPPHSAEGGAWPRTSALERPLPNTGPAVSRDVMTEYGMAGHFPAREQLYDLVMDPMERVNRADDSDCERPLAAMQARLERWMRQTNDPLLEGNGPDTGPNVVP
ncbi:MAG: sulfatase [Candidatus Brocadiia bacterium]